VQSRIASVALAAVSLLFLVDLFLPWSRSGLENLGHDRTNAWETGPGLLGAATLITLATDGFYNAELAYGSWIGLGLCLVMATASLARLLEHRWLTATGGWA
jgi:hypothetical protein